MAQEKSGKRLTAERQDGRRPFMTYMNPELIKALKKRALDADKHAYELVESFVAEGLARESDNPTE